MSRKTTISKSKLVAIILVLAVLVFSLYGVVTEWLGYAQGEERVEEAVRIVTSNNTATANNPNPRVVVSTENEQSSGTNSLLPAEEIVNWLSSLNISELQSVNPDVVGWIHIPDTDISYPLLQVNDNDFYLKHSWDGEKNVCGSIFLDKRSTINDWNTVIYGHNMRNGSMFGGLKKYQDEDFAKEHKELYVVYEGEIRKFSYVTTFEADLEGIPYVFGDFDSEKKEQFKTELLNITGANVDGPVLSLSTCTGSGHSTRRVVIFQFSDVFSAAAAQN